MCECKHIVDFYFNTEGILLNREFYQGYRNINHSGGRPPPPPRAPKFFWFHAVFRKIWQNFMLAPPPPRSWPPPRGNPGSDAESSQKIILVSWLFEMKYLPSTSNCISFIFPSLDATCKGVIPFILGALTSAPLEARNCTMSGSLKSTAVKRLVIPSSSRAWMSAPLCISVFAIFTNPKLEDITLKDF